MIQLILYFPRHVYLDVLDEVLQTYGETYCTEYTIEQHLLPVCVVTVRVGTRGPVETGPALQVYGSTLDGRTRFQVAAVDVQAPVSALSQKDRSATIC